MKAFPRRTGYLLIVGIIFGILCCIVGCVVITNKYLEMAREYDKHYPFEKLPIRTLSVQIEQVQREQLFTQLQKFSDKYYLTYDLSFYENKKVFFIVMEGKGLEISALSNPVHTTELEINFYEKDPANPPSQETVDELFDDLKNLIGEIPNVTITGEK